MTRSLVMFLLLVLVTAVSSTRMIIEKEARDGTRPESCYKTCSGVHKGTWADTTIRRRSLGINIPRASYQLLSLRSCRFTAFHRIVVAVVPPWSRPGDNEKCPSNIERVRKVEGYYRVYTNLPAHRTNNKRWYIIWKAKGWTC